MRKMHVLEAASENGAGKRGASLGPAAVILEAAEQCSEIFRGLPWTPVPDLNHLYDCRTPNRHAKNIENLSESLEWLCDAVQKVLDAGEFPLIISGDHSNAIGAYSGVRNHYHNERIGIIWVDAHYDLHSPFTTPSGNVHGMALNALIADDNLDCQRNEPSVETIGYWEKLKRLGHHQITPKLLPSDLAFVGVRDAEDEECHLVNKYGIFDMEPEEVDQYGIDQVIDMALDQLKDCDRIYVSFDVDSQDTSISMGTGTPVPEGLDYPQAVRIFERLFHHPKVCAFEITEINPMLDKDNSMAKIVMKLLSAVLPG
jgi:arginase